MAMEVDTEFKEEEELKVRDNERGNPIPRELMFREMGLNACQKRRNCVIGKKILSDSFASSADYNLVACCKKLNTKCVSDILVTIASQFTFVCLGKLLTIF